MKKALSLALAAAMAASLAACGGSSAASTASSAATTDTAASGAASAGGQTLKVMLSEEPGEGDAFATTLNKWADETGNTVDIMVIPYDDQLTKFPLMAKNNDLPDLLSTTRLARLYPDEFEDLGQYIDTSIFEPQALQIISQNYLTDKLSVLPQQFTITNVFYNKDAFEAAGLECPTVDDRWTMDEVYEAAKKLQDSGAVKYGMAMDASRARYDNLMYMNGGSLVEKDGDSFKVVADSQQNVDTLQSFVDANNSGVMPRPSGPVAPATTRATTSRTATWASTSPAPGTITPSCRISPASSSASCPLLSALQAVPLSWAVPVWPFPPTQRTKIWLLSS